VARSALLALCLALVVASAAAEPRVVSLNPSLTAILLALDARSTLVGVDDWSARDLPEVGGLPRVGGLFNPSLEAILALRPDLVVWVPSAQQRSLRERLEALGVAVLELENITLDQLLAGIETLGERIGRGDAARRRVREVRRAFAEAERAATASARPRTVWVLQRDPLYVVGGGSFLDEMLRAAGAVNLAAGFDEPYPRVGVEWLIAAEPELILDAADPPEEAETHWSRWPSLPAVADGRIVAVPAKQITLPGPYVDRAVRWLADAVRPPSVEVGERSEAPPTP
jgi:ABC-type Fe3+-hydroxamate transport system substrate-binding protein